MAVEKLIVDHIDTWTTARQTRSTAGRGSSGKIDLYGIKKLRELILELAVRGKLVPQDPNDEPASVLLKRIAAEKAELVKLGKIKKPKPLPEISEEEKSFELPEGWEWVRFGSIYEMEYGNNLPQEKRSNSGEYNVYGSNGIVGTHNEACIKSPCIVIGRKGSAGALNLSDQAACWVTDVAYSTIPPSAMDLEFVFIQFHTLGLDTLGKGIKPGLNRNDAYNLTIAIPPQSEQKAIVSKVNELMTLCDQLEQHSLTSLDAHQQLVETLLTTLTDSQNADELAENWARISEYFDTLFTTEASIDALKQTILQLAVMGKLVPQDPNDEPASELLKRIAQEKAQLMKDGKIKKQKPLPPISDEEKPFELPDGWEWSRLDHVASKITDGDHKTPPRIAEGYKLLSAKNIRDGFLDYENCDYISESSYIKSRERCLPEKGDLLIVSVGGTIGRSSLITGNSEFALVRSVAIIKPLIIEPNFLKIAMDSQLLQSMIHSHKRGGAQPCLYLGEISKFLFPTPPLNEQRRIVKTVNIFMGILETLTLAFNSAQKTQLHLADALTDAAIN
ncbi:TPA: restriction endonuclease subunit S [Salmonella enterica subsp. houtenae]|nr:restriction endonuclease subunit S [Salmonella enterica subsp. houtenae]ECT3980263.1 restriction endonuclease subunit S [Salmonella enterica subsp. houtenae serovar 53:z4,z23:-]EGI6179303.1 restriction endonuclease subunit S [Salmonella enterica subsp. houtenae serovar 51:z4,z23:-]EKO1015924.1 restriction endonuclease subunit S [Salmonella enterica subsp. enterica]ECF6023373.1 restriction endonuclease subunit S [Salmonella enterica subsp. houtenae]